VYEWYWRKGYPRTCYFHNPLFSITIGEPLFTIFAHYHKRYSFRWTCKETNTVHWKGTARLTVPRNLSAMYRILFVRRGFKSSKFYKECMSSLAVLPQKFWCFSKPISPRILHPKSQKFHHLLGFTSSLSFSSKIVSSMMPSMRKVVC